MASKERKTPNVMSLYGVVVCGGRSSRMGFDKSTVVYYQKPQHEHVADLLSPLCEKVFLSCNKEQFPVLQSDYEKLADDTVFADSGPIAALLTAFKTFPGHDFLVAGCDYPFLTSDELSSFLQSIDKDLPSAAFYNEQGFYEPLLGWYSGNAHAALLSDFNAGNHSLQHFLRNINALKYIPESDQIMTSIDTYEDFQAIKKLLDSHDKR
jgi:molybdenum cofactor guanylyltransferase